MILANIPLKKENHCTGVSRVRLMSHYFLFHYIHSIIIILIAIIMILIVKKEKNI